jgi:metal transporter CNNM
LPLFLDHVIPSYLAIILSVSLVLIFGEIVPSAIFTGSRKLQLAAHFAEFTQFLIWIFFPIAKPISMLLDYIIDHEETKIYSRQELAAFVSVQHSLANGTTDSLSGDEVMIVHGLLKMSTQCVANIMTPIEQVFTLQSNTVLDQNKLGDILRQGFSRIPIYEGNDCGNTRGYLLVKKLIVVDPNDKRLVSSFSLKRPLVVHPKLSLLELLNQFQQGTHLAVASRNPAKTIENLDNNQPLIGDSRVIGIITLEDVFEELLQEEIEDEHDKHRLKVEKHYLNVIKACISKKKKKRNQIQKKIFLGTFSKLGCW